jgi:hypothetical protein
VPVAATSCHGLPGRSPHEVLTQVWVRGMKRRMLGAVTKRVLPWFVVVRGVAEFIEHLRVVEPVAVRVFGLGAVLGWHRSRPTAPGARSVGSATGDGNHQAD